MTILLVVPAMAQPQESCECVFGPKAGQVQFNFSIGAGQFFNDMTGLYYMLPDEDGTAIGIGSDRNTLEPGTYGNAYISGDLSTLLTNSGSLNYTMRNYSVGMKVFLTDHFNLNLSGAYMLNMQPSKSFQEGESYRISDLNFKDYDVSVTPATVGPGDDYAHKAILGAVTNKLMVQLGGEWYFNTRNERIFPYVGLFGQFKMARIESFYPSTGQYMPTDYQTSTSTTIDKDPTSPTFGQPITSTLDENYPDMANEEVDLYRTSRGGQALGFGGGINFGVEFALMEGLFIGVEVAPVCYQ